MKCCQTTVTSYTRLHHQSLCREDRLKMNHRQMIKTLDSPIDHRRRLRFPSTCSVNLIYPGRCRTRAQARRSNFKKETPREHRFKNLTKHFADNHKQVVKHNYV